MLTFCVEPSSVSALFPINPPEDVQSSETVIVEEPAVYVLPSANVKLFVFRLKLLASKVLEPPINLEIVSVNFPTISCLSGGKLSHNWNIFSGGGFVTVSVMLSKY